jgi:hypothetical protein
LRVPPDPTGAVGTRRYIELTNFGFSIYDKTADSRLATGSLQRLTGSKRFEVFDPQIIWDPTTKRFYYSAAERETDTLFGFSKKASPNTGGKADWCRYHIHYSRPVFPDFPRLGDSRRFAIIGANAFGRGGHPYLRPVLTAISKPRPGHLRGCPKRSKFKTTQKWLPAKTFSAVPANEIDSEGTGWVVANPNPELNWPQDQIELFKVKKGRRGGPIIRTTPSAVTVSPYTYPAYAPEKDTTSGDPGALLDTLDGRYTQAVAAEDPAQGNKLAIWTQHTVGGGAGSAIRWYELDPAAKSLLQQGQVVSPSLYGFNGAISPDRQVTDRTTSGGSSMAMTYNTSSSTTYPAIATVSKRAGEDQTDPVIIKRSTNSLDPIDYGPCWNDTYCRWGDYAGATPDPTSDSVWEVNEYVGGTWNFVVTP